MHNESTVQLVAELIPLCVTEGGASLDRIFWIHVGAPLHVECAIALRQEPMLHLSSSCLVLLVKM